MYYLLNTLYGTILKQSYNTEGLFDKTITYKIEKIGESYYIRDVKIDNKELITINHSYSKEYTEEEVHREVKAFILYRIRQEFVPNIRLTKTY